MPPPQRLWGCCGVGVYRRTAVRTEERWQMQSRLADGESCRALLVAALERARRFANNNASADVRRQRHSES